MPEVPKLPHKAANMNVNIERLYQIGVKPERLIIGLMSGTSVDGLDVALCKCSGSGKTTTVDIIQFETIPYDEDFKAEIKSVFSKREDTVSLYRKLNFQSNNFTAGT